MEMDSFSEGEYDSDASGMDDNAEDDVPNEQDNELNNEETEDDGKGESKSNSKSTLMSNISKLSKYKSNMHRKDVRKIKSKEKRDRRERAKVRGCGHFTSKKCCYTQFICRNWVCQSKLLEQLNRPDSPMKILWSQAIRKLRLTNPLMRCRHISKRKLYQKF